jgi:hypothetical protein
MRRASPHGEVAAGEGGDDAETTRIEGAETTRIRSSGGIGSEAPRAEDAGNAAPEGIRLAHAPAAIALIAAARAKDRIPAG